MISFQTAQAIKDDLVAWKTIGTGLPTFSQATTAGLDAEMDGLGTYLQTLITATPINWLAIFQAIIPLLADLIPLLILIFR
jgi:hypothetical protein